MEVKYQVFVSSTYTDLYEERQEVMQALLELDCIPVGMELFPAADDDQWTLIKRLIDDCDYYVIIIGGRYGSINSYGISFTQMEYEYAQFTGIPIIGFLPKNPSEITLSKSEIDPEARIKLDKFKLIVQKKTCRFYENSSELGSQVSRSLVRLIKDKPRPGWVKSSALPSADVTKELLLLKNEVDRLKIELEQSNSKGPKGTEALSQGEDRFKIKYGSQVTFRVFGSYHNITDELVLTWNEIFAFISPFMLDESSEIELAKQVNALIAKKLVEIGKDAQVSDSGFGSYSKVGLLEECFNTLIVQFKALGLIKKSTKKRSIKDTANYWTLTPFGEYHMTRLVAIIK